MDAAIGKRLRMSRIVHSTSARTILVAYAHGVLLGPLAGMASRGELARQAKTLRQADGVLVPPGLLRYLVPLFEGRDAPGLMVLLGWQNISRPAPLLGYREGSTALLASLEQVAVSGAAGVMTYLYLGFDDPHDEAREIEQLVRVQEACDRLGLVHLVESRAVHHEQDADGQFRLDVLKLHTRIAAEIGADLVKTKYPGHPEALQELVESCPCPIVIAGGPRKERAEDAYQLAREIVEGGGAGIVFGRNIYQQPDPAAALRTFRAIVHGEDGGRDG